jgi:UDP-glucuronate 4-epimerase
MRDEKVLVAGCSSQVALPLAVELAKNNEVWGVARFRDSSAREQLEASGVRCESADLSSGDLSSIPDDFAYALNFSVSRTGSWQKDLDANVVALGFLMEHCRNARAFFHCSTSGVYQSQTDHLHREGDPLGDNHRPWETTLPFLSTYSISKIAAESMATYCSRRFALPTVIARLAVPYGDNGGWPAFHLELMAAGAPIELHPDRPNRFNPIHETDIVATVPALLSAASVPARAVNWGGPECSLEQWCSIMGRLTGMVPEFAETTATICGVPLDLSELESLTGLRTFTAIEDGIAKMVRARRPDLLAGS